MLIYQSLVKLEFAIFNFAFYKNYLDLLINSDKFFFSYSVICD